MFNKRNISQLFQLEESAHVVGDGTTVRVKHSGKLCNVISLECSCYFGIYRRVADSLII